MKPQLDIRRTIKATETFEAWPEDEFASPGAVYVDRDETYKDHLLFACPGCGRMGGIRATSPKNVGGQSWEIVGGTLVSPLTLTLSPSIHCVGCCGWHGYLRNGVFESC